VSEWSTNLHTAVSSRRDLDLGPMALKLDQEIGILERYLHTDNEVARLSRSNIIA